MDFNSIVKIFVFSHFTMPTDTYSTRVSSIGNTQEILGHPSTLILVLASPNLVAATFIKRRLLRKYFLLQIVCVVGQCIDSIQGSVFDHRAAINKGFFNEQKSPNLHVIICNMGKHILYRGT